MRSWIRWRYILASYYFAADIDHRLYLHPAALGRTCTHAGTNIYVSYMIFVLASLDACTILNFGLLSIPPWTRKRCRVLLEGLALSRVVWGTWLEVIERSTAMQPYPDTVQSVHRPLHPSLLPLPTRVPSRSFMWFIQLPANAIWSRVRDYLRTQGLSSVSMCTASHSWHSIQVQREWDLLVRQ